MRQVKIVATVGPATSSPERLEALLRAGVDVVRLNFSHGTQEEHAEVLHRVRDIGDRLGRPVAVLQDLAGPKIRIGELDGGRPVTLVDGEPVAITTRPQAGTAKMLSTSYEHLPRDVRPGDLMLLADGRIALRVTGTAPQEVQATVVHGGVLAEHQGINLPGVGISAPALTEKDRHDLAFGLSLGVDYVALSFVREPQDVREAKDIIAAHGANTPVIAKLEKREAISRLDEILAVSDGVMVARGDLGIDLPLEDVPLLQKTIIRKANERGVAVITATQMLESMINNPQPTRAEVSDVVNAILDGTDAVMLSGETAVGQYPVEAVEMMERIARATRQEPREVRVRPKAESYAEAISRASASLAEDVQARALVVFTRSGYTAHLVSKQRPPMPILALTISESVCRRLMLWWGVMPVRTEFREHTDAMIAHTEEVLLRRSLVAHGDHIVVVGSSPVLAEARTNFVKLHRISG